MSSVFVGSGFGRIGDVAKPVFLSSGAAGLGNIDTMVSELFGLTKRTILTNSLGCDVSTKFLFT